MPARNVPENSAGSGQVFTSRLRWDSIKSPVQSGGNRTGLRGTRPWLSAQLQRNSVTSEDSVRHLTLSPVCYREPPAQLSITRQIEPECGITAPLARPLARGRGRTWHGSEQWQTLPTSRYAPGPTNYGRRPEGRQVERTTSGTRPNKNYTTRTKTRRCEHLIIFSSREFHRSQNRALRLGFCATRPFHFLPHPTSGLGPLCWRAL